LSYYEEIVAEYLCAKRTRFVSPNYCLDIGDAGPHGKDRSWWIDVLAVDFDERAIFLCEATFAQKPVYMFRRLRRWASIWPEIELCARRLTGAPDHWRVEPWVFMPKDLKATFDKGFAAIIDSPFSVTWTAFEDIVPWKRPQLSALTAAAKRAVASN